MPARPANQLLLDIDVIFDASKRLVFQPSSQENLPLLICFPREPPGRKRDAETKTYGPFSCLVFSLSLFSLFLSSLLLLPSPLFFAD